MHPPPFPPRTVLGVMNGQEGGQEWARRRTGPPNEEAVHDLSSRSGITITKAVGGGPKTTELWLLCVCGGGGLELSRYTLKQIQIMLKTARKCQKGGARGCKRGCLQSRRLGMSPPPPLKEGCGCKLLTKPLASVT